MALLGMAGLAAPLGAQTLERNILTGGPTGTYIQMGRDIADAAASCGITLNVRESAGSLENFLGVRMRPQTQFGIVQSDVLEYLDTFAAEESDLARAVAGVRIAFPLHDEEVHVLARRDIGSLRDLADRRVSIGVEDSGTFLTASLVLDLAQVVPGTRVLESADTSLQLLLDDRIDAFFYVAGAPAAIFGSPRIDPARFHLLPITDPTLQAVYRPTSIAAGTYPFQADAVDVVAVKAVLMTYEFNPRRNAYHRESCRAVADIAQVISTRFQALQESGHPKWRQVDLSDLPPGWDVAGCVLAGLTPGRALRCDDPGAPTSATVPPGTAESEANRAYRRRICEAVGC
ncbi:C4-dicarboxylate ABC transporter substrate-binding protein [Rhodobaculum claviforme]|uniref:C4-dicarboxylate ABC transporter substrate-binding protein n=2 Tax=Rhodobaculum claviforme TaxID=1549854 RepID=A0A934TJE3_9RHOB|nr:C4-dicarboxylate ABC transporter substrate-binding protein [Rhodobaculum claviforme]